MLRRPVAVMRFDELADVAAYDGVWANASLLHVPREMLADVLTRVYKALRPGGLHCASFKAGDYAGRDSLGRYFNYPDREVLISAYESSAPWRILSVAIYVGGGYECGEGPWLALTAQKP